MIDTNWSATELENLLNILRPEWELPRGFPDLSIGDSRFKAVTVLVHYPEPEIRDERIEHARKCHLIIGERVLSIVDVDLYCLNCPECDLRRNRVSGDLYGCSGRNGCGGMFDMPALLVWDNNGWAPTQAAQGIPS